MEKLVAWLSKRKGLSLSIVLVYFAIIITMHHTMVTLSVFVMDYLTRQVYDIVIGIIALVVLGGILFFFIKALLKFPHATDLKIAYLIIVVSLLLLHTQINFVMNIELIHTAQFGILAALIFPLTRRFGDTLFYTMLLGAVDEWYQYQILYPEKTDYYDFNDLVLNQLGAGFALILLYAAGANNKTFPAKMPWFQSPVFYSLIVLVGTVWLLFRLSLMQLYAGANEKALFILNEASGPEEFWRHLPNSDIVYHVMQPLEGVLILTLICALFFFLDYLARYKLAGKTVATTFNAQHFAHRAI